MASAIPTPHVPFALGSSSLLDIPRPGAPHPFFSSLLHPGFCFGVLLSYFFVCFCGFFFVVFVDLLRASFAALRPLLGFFHSLAATSFHCALLCTGSTYMQSVFFRVSFCLYSVLLLFFSLYFVCYLFVIMLWPRWFDWIPFDPDMWVVDVYVTLAFESMRKNGLDFCVIDECVSWLNCRGG
jgi:hypothetical protein